jgi:hypothetical protein
MILPEEVFKRRHFNTPWSVLLIMTDYTAVFVLFSIYHHTTPNWFFWLVIAVLVLYNFLELRKNRELITRSILIVYVLSLLFLIFLYFFF